MERLGDRESAQMIDQEQEEGSRLIHQDPSVDELEEDGEVFLLIVKLQRLQGDGGVNLTKQHLQWRKGTGKKKRYELSPQRCRTNQDHYLLAHLSF